ncbi:MAG: cation:proton antiporter [Chthoniobacterales bacterium]
MTSIAFLTWILALGITAQWLAWRFKLPSILLLLAFGFGFGQITGVRIDDFLAAGDGHSSPLLSVVGLFVAIILFEGGLTLKFRELRESGLPILRLCTIAVAISFGLTTGFMTWILGYDIRIAALIGSILTVTGPTVIAPLLRHVSPNKKIASIVKWEGIMVDPIGAILAVLVFKAALSSNITDAWTNLLQSTLVFLLVGILGAFILAKIVEFLLRHHSVPDFLQPVFLLSLVAVAFTVSNAIEKESGLLTVTVLGVLLANQRSVSVKHILEFKENLRTLIISALFLILSGRIAPTDLGDTLGKGAALLAFLIIIGRPLSVYASLIFSTRTSFRERTFLAFLAPRGIVAAAVASIFALEFQLSAAHGAFGAELSPVIADQARDIVALIFLVIVGTVCIYGLTAKPLARHLGLAVRNPTGILFAGANKAARLIAKALYDEGHRVMLLDTNFSNVAAAKMLGMEAHRANILSEFAEEELDFNGLIHLIACTPNDEVNSIAAYKFSHFFTRAHVWQLSPADKDEHHSKAAADEVRSRLCFSGGPNYTSLQEKAEAGFVVKKNQITEIFDFEKFSSANPEAIILFLQDSKGLRPAEAGLSKVPAGTTIFAFVPKVDEAEKAARAKAAQKA